MEAFQLIISAISTVGFPVIVAVFFLYRLSKQDERHAAQFEEMRKSIDNNTQVIKELMVIIKEEKK